MNQQSECLLLFSSEYSVFASPLKEVIDYNIQNYNFTFVLYGYETWSLTLRVELRLRVFENRVLKIIFGPKREEVAGGWRRLHNEELHNVYPSSYIIRMIKSSRSQWPRGLRHVLSSTARTLGSRVRIPLEAWMCLRLSVFCCPV
jgi:hypothetical protein